MGGDPDTLSDVELWQQIVRCLHAARKKIGVQTPIKHAIKSKIVSAACYPARLWESLKISSCFCEFYQHNVASKQGDSQHWRNHPELWLVEALRQHLDIVGLPMYRCSAYACAGPGDLGNMALQQLRQEAQALMADIGASAAMQLQQGVPVVVQGPNGQQQHYITLGALQGAQQQQQLPAWPVRTLP